MHRRQFLAAAAATPFAGAALPRLSSAASAGQKPNTKFAINAEMWWHDQPFLDRVRNAAKAGFAAIEFWPWRGKDIPALAALTQELGIEVSQFLGWGFTPGLNDPKNHDAFVEEIEASCDTAHQLGAKKMCVIAGQNVPGMTEPEMHDNVIEGLKRAAPIAERADVMLILEPLNIRVDHKGHCLHDSDSAIRICDAVGSTHVKINWDLYHMQIAEGDLCRRLRDGFRHVGYIQVADNPGRNEPGTGEVHWPRVLRELKDLGYTGAVGLECWPKEGEAKAIERVRAADVF